MTATLAQQHAEHRAGIAARVALEADGFSVLGGEGDWCEVCLCSPAERKIVHDGYTDRWVCVRPYGSTRGPACL